MSLLRRIAGHTHPWLAALRTGAVDTTSFWAKVAEVGTPLIEADASSPDHLLVTFLWRHRDQDRWVALSLEGANLAAGLLTRHAGTDVRYATYRCRHDLRVPYHIAANVPSIDPDHASAAEIVELGNFLAGASSGPDPLHHDNERYGSPTGGDDFQVSVLTLPNAPDESRTRKRDGIVRGTLETHELESPALGNARRVWVYTPPRRVNARAADTPLPWLLAFDAGTYLAQMFVHRIVDNLCADGIIAPTMVVPVDNPSAESRNLELPSSEPFVQFLAQELVPWLRDRYPLSREAADSFVTGASYVGLAALWAGYRLSHIFGNVIAQGASLWWGPGHRLDVPRNEGIYRREWLIDEFERASKLPLRIWLEVGLLEHPIFMLASNRRLRRILESKGYDLRYLEPAGGHETAVWRGTLARALAEMLPRPRELRKGAP